MWKFIRHEWKYWIYSPMTWIFFIINTLLVMGAVSSDSITIGGGVGSVHKNAPFVIQTYFQNYNLIIYRIKIVLSRFCHFFTFYKI